MKKTKDKNMNTWFWYAIGAAVLYGLHQIFTKLAADRIGDGLGGFVVEATAALTILTYLIYLRVAGNWNQSVSAPGRLVFRPHRHLCWRGRPCWQWRTNETNQTQKHYEQRK